MRVQLPNAFVLGSDPGETSKPAHFGISGLKRESDPADNQTSRGTRIGRESLDFGISRL
jgi:hypothetical protein